MYAAVRADPVAEHLSRWQWIGQSCSVWITRRDVRRSRLVRYFWVFWRPGNLTLELFSRKLTHRRDYATSAMGTVRMHHCGFLCRLVFKWWARRLRDGQTHRRTVKTRNAAYWIMDCSRCCCCCWRRPKYWHGDWKPGWRGGFGLHKICTCVNRPGLLLLLQCDATTRL